MQADEQGLTFVFVWRQQDWGLYNRRNEALAKELSTRPEVAQVVHVEVTTPKNLVRTLLKYFTARSRTLKEIYLLHLVKAIRPTPVPITDTFGVLSLVTVPLGANRIGQWLNETLLRFQIRPLQRGHATKAENARIVVAYPPSRYLAWIVDLLGPDLLLADLVDDVPARSVGATGIEASEEAFTAILPACDWVYATSSQLVDKYGGSGTTIEFLANGVDLANTTGSEMPGGRPRGNVGYVGTINQTMDIDLVEHIIANNPTVLFMFIGPVRKSVAPAINRLRETHKNVCFIGERSHVEIPDYLSECSVLINVKKADHTTQGGESIKIYEYLATGKPIVSTSVPPADRLAPLVYVADDKHQFDLYVKRALTENDPIRNEERKRAAAKNSWRNRSEVILARVRQLLSTPSRS